MHEFEEVASIIHKEMDEEANIILGMAIDPSVGDEIRVTVIATGIGRMDQVSQRAAGQVAAPKRVKPEGIVPELNYDYLQIPTVVRHRGIRETGGQQEQPRKKTFLQKLTGAGTNADDEDLNIPTFIRRQAD